MDSRTTASVYTNCFWRLGKPTGRIALKISFPNWRNKKTLPYIDIKILSIYGGAGSFNDLVLYKDGVFYMKENNKLERLRNGLYNKITEKWN